MLIISACAPTLLPLTLTQWFRVVWVFLTDSQGELFLEKKNGHIFKVIYAFDLVGYLIPHISVTLMLFIEWTQNHWELEGSQYFNSLRLLTCHSMIIILSLCWYGLDLRTGCAEECSTILFFHALCSHFITPPNLKRDYLLKKIYLLMGSHNVSRGILFIRGYSQIKRTTPLSNQKGNYIVAIVKSLQHQRCWRMFIGPQFLTLP